MHNRQQRRRFDHSDQFDQFGRYDRSYVYKPTVRQPKSLFDMCFESTVTGVRNGSLIDLSGLATMLRRQVFDAVLGFSRRRSLSQTVLKCFGGPGFFRNFDQIDVTGLDPRSCHEFYLVLNRNFRLDRSAAENISCLRLSVDTGADQDSFDAELMSICRLIHSCPQLTRLSIKGDSTQVNLLCCNFFLIVAETVGDFDRIPLREFRLINLTISPEFRAISGSLFNSLCNVELDNVVLHSAVYRSLMICCRSSLTSLTLSRVTIQNDSSIFPFDFPRLESLIVFDERYKNHFLQPELDRLKNCPELKILHISVHDELIDDQTLLELPKMDRKLRISLTISGSHTAAVRVVTNCGPNIIKITKRRNAVISDELMELIRRKCPNLDPDTLQHLSSRET